LILRWIAGEKRAEMKKEEERVEMFLHPITAIFGAITAIRGAMGP
jgi:hypothetical protein